MSSISVTIPRGLDINYILQQIVDWGLTLENLTIHRKDVNSINICVSSEHDLDIGMFEEFLQELEYQYEQEFDEGIV